MARGAQRTIAVLATRLSNPKTRQATLAIGLTHLGDTGLEGQEANRLVVVPQSINDLPPSFFRIRFRGILDGGRAEHHTLPSNQQRK